MNPNKKVIITLICGILAMALIACSCSSLLPTGLSSNTEAIPGLAGSWRSVDTDDVYQIAWQNNQYEVLSAIYQGTTYDITSQSWDGSSLTWSYYDTDLSLTVTLQTTSISGDTVYIDWSLSDGSSGSSTLSREP